MQETIATSTLPATPVQAERLLRGVLSLNAATSVAAGLVGAIAATWTADLLGIGQTGWVRAVSLGLVVFAVGVALVARSSREQLRRWAPEVSILDFVWVAGTVAVVALGSLSGVGLAIALAQGAGVLLFGLVQLLLTRRATL